MREHSKSSPFHSSKEEIERARSQPQITQEQYVLAFCDDEFLRREELRPVRLQLELMKPELVLQDNNIDKTVVVFGSARTPDPDVAQKDLELAEAALAKTPNDADAQRAVKRARNILDNSSYLQEATKLAYRVSNYEKENLVIVTGGGPAFMRAANKGASEAGKRSVALGVILPNEQVPNEFVEPELTFQFHYFAIRKMHFLMRAQALVAFPGGFGTFDELFETLTLMQTQKIKRIPLILFNKRFWTSVMDLEALVDEGTISAKDLDLIKYVDTAEEAWEIISAFYAE